MHFFDQAHSPSQQKKSSLGISLSRTFSMPSMRSSRPRNRCPSASDSLSTMVDSTTSTFSCHDSVSHCSSIDDARTVINLDSPKKKKCASAKRPSIISRPLGKQNQLSTPSMWSSSKRQRRPSLPDPVSHNASQSLPASLPRLCFKSTLTWLLNLHKRNTPSSTGTAEDVHYPRGGPPTGTSSCRQSNAVTESLLPTHPFVQSQNMFADHPPSPQHPCTVTPAIPIPISANPACFPGKNPSDLLSKQHQLAHLQYICKRSPSSSATQAGSSAPALPGARHLIPHHHNHHHLLQPSHSQDSTFSSPLPPSVASPSSSADGSALSLTSSPKFQERISLPPYPSPPMTPPFLAARHLPIRSNSGQYNFTKSCPSSPGGQSWTPPPTATSVVDPSLTSVSSAAHSMEEMEVLALGMPLSIRKGLQGQKHHIDSLSPSTMYYSTSTSSSSSYSGPRKSLLGEGYDITTMWSLGPISSSS